MAKYQINYGFTKDGVAEPTKPSEEEEKPAGEAVVGRALLLLLPAS